MLAGANVNWAEFLSAVKVHNDSTGGSTDNSFRYKPSARQERRQQSNNFNDFSDVGGKSRSSQEKYHDELEINPMFEKAFENVGPTSSFRSFLESVHEWWEDKGFLTEKQYYAVKRAAEG
jgi:hypothetical protein